jgi:hypothetical protein
MGEKGNFFSTFRGGDCLPEFPKNNDFPAFQAQEGLVSFLLFISLQF